MTSVLLGFFRYQNDAEAAVDRLLARAYNAGTMALLYEESDDPAHNTAGAIRVSDDAPIPMETFSEALFGAALTETAAAYYRYCLAQGDALLAVRTDESGVAEAEAQFGRAYSVETHRLGSDAVPAPSLTPQSRRAAALAQDEQRRAAQLAEDFARYGDAPVAPGHQPHFRAARASLADPRLPTTQPQPAPPSTRAARPFDTDKFTKPMKPKPDPAQ